MSTTPHDRPVPRNPFSEKPSSHTPFSETPSSQNGPVPRTRMAILALDGCLASSVTGPADVFRVADMLRCADAPPREDSNHPRANLPDAARPEKGYAPSEAAHRRSAWADESASPQPGTVPFGASFSERDQRSAEDAEQLTCGGCAKGQAASRAEATARSPAANPQDAGMSPRPGGFHVEVLTPGGRAAGCLGGFALQGKPLQQAQPDVLFLPAFYGNVEDHLGGEAVEQIRRMAEQGTVICGVCAGVFLMASAGILDNREATTHWGLAQRFTELFPRVRLRSGDMIVDRGHTVCAGGVTAWADLSLHLVARFGSPELASACSRMLLIDPARRSQAPYAATAFVRTHGDGAILAVQDALERDFSRGLSLADMARCAGMTERTLQRRFRSATGLRPREYLQRVRVEAARRLLESTALSVEEITDRVGYADAPSFGRLFREVTGLSPGSYRKRFSLRPGTLSA